MPSQSTSLPQEPDEQFDTGQALQAVFDRANDRGRRLGYESEQQVHDARPDDSRVREN